MSMVGHAYMNMCMYAYHLCNVYLLCIVIHTAIDLIPFVVSFSLTLLLGIEVCGVFFNVRSPVNFAKYPAVWCANSNGGVCADAALQACSAEAPSETCRYNYT